MILKFEITNLPQFQASLNKLKNQVLMSIETGLEAGAEQIANNARERAPVKTGALRNSIRVRKGDGDYSLLVEATAPHARFIEFGTLKTPAKPFLVPAAEDGAETFKAGLAQTISNAIKG